MVCHQWERDNVQIGVTNVEFRWCGVLIILFSTRKIIKSFRLVTDITRTWHWGQCWHTVRICRIAPWDTVFYYDFHKTYCEFKSGKMISKSGTKLPYHIFPHYCLVVVRNDGQQVNIAWIIRFPGGQLQNRSMNSHFTVATIFIYFLLSIDSQVTAAYVLSQLNLSPLTQHLAILSITKGKALIPCVLSYRVR